MIWSQTSGTSLQSLFYLPSPRVPCSWHYYLETLPEFPSSSWTLVHDFHFSSSIWKWNHFPGFPRNPVSVPPRSPKLFKQTNEGPFEPLHVKNEGIAWEKYLQFSVTKGRVYVNCPTPLTLRGQASPSVVLPTSVWGRYYYPHFADDRTKV